MTLWRLCALSVSLTVPGSLQADEVPGTAAEAQDTKGHQAFFRQDFEAAETHWTKAAKLVASVPANRAEYAGYLESLAGAQTAQHKYAAAAANLIVASRICKALHGETHTDVGRIAFNLAIVHQHLGQFRMAEDSIITYARVKQKNGTTATSYRGEVYALLGVLYAEFGLYEDAEKCCLRAADYYHGNNGGPYQALVFQTLVVVYSRANKLKKAEHALTRAMKSSGQCAPNTLAGARYSIASGRPKQAEQVLSEMIEEERKSRHPDKLTLAELRADLGTAKGRAGDLTAAKELLLTAVTDYEAVLGPNHPRVAEALNRYVRLFPEVSREHEARAAKIRERNEDKKPRGFKAVSHDLGW